MPSALRLSFSYDGPSVNLDSIQGIDAPTPASDPVEHGDEAGFWSELRDANNAVLYRQIGQNPIRLDVEVFSDDATQTISRQPVQAPSGSFDLLLPNLPNAVSVVLMSSPLDGTFGAPAAQLASFPLQNAEPVA